MKEHENILVFSESTNTYNPIKEARKGTGSKRLKYGHNGSITGEVSGGQKFNGWEVGKYDENFRNPSSIQYFNNRDYERGLHPTQKPVALYDYLIRTYTNEGDTVLDFCFGSGTTGVSCMRTNRNFIGCEKDTEHGYFQLAEKRIKQASLQKPLF